jgi:hypothetical protein
MELGLVKRLGNYIALPTVFALFMELAKRELLIIHKPDEMIPLLVQD